jgi:DNA-3-methyladenine glycosylase II
MAPAANQQGDAMASPTFTITPIGPFSLAEAATFGFGQRADGTWDGVMRLAFCLDSYTAQVGVEVRQDDAGVVRGTIIGPAGADVDAVRGQVARVLSLDHDGEEFTRIGERDPVIGRLQQIAPGLRPPLFYSPYEAAAWSVLSARRPARQMMAVRLRLSKEYGAVFDLAGQHVAAFPTPEALLRVETFPGIPADKLGRLHGVAAAAIAGQLDSTHLLALGPDAAAAELQQLKGIGPFYSALIVIRGTGFADVLPVAEPKALALAGRLYEMAGPVSADKLAELAEPWKPLRTWAVVLIRAAGPRLLGDDLTVSPPSAGSDAPVAPAAQRGRVVSGRPGGETTRRRSAATTNDRAKTPTG